MEGTPLMISAAKGHSHIVQWLLEHGAAIDAKTSYHETALMKSIFFECQETTKLLLDSGADPNITTLSNKTALDYAERSQQYEILRALINAGAYMDNIDCYGETILMRACKNGDYEIAKILLDAGFDPTVMTNFDEMSALEIARWHLHDDIVELILS